MERKVLDTVLIELDGVLADTGPTRREVLRSVLRDESIALSELEYRDECAGLPMPDAVRAAVALRAVPIDDTGLDLLCARAERAYSAWVGKGVVLVDGAREFVEGLAARVRVGIVSRSNRRDIELVLNLARLEHACTIVVGAEDAYPHKPSPAPYLAALRRLARKRPIPAGGVVLALEDGRAGIRAARAAGLRCIAVGDLPAHVAMEADAIVPAITGLDCDAVGALVLRDGGTVT
jgi:mannitol-1-/sugar-/sorbitol-6-phosphatase